MARRYTENANLILKLLSNSQYATRALKVLSTEGVGFLPVEIAKDARGASPATVVVKHTGIELAGKHRMRLIGSFDPEALVRLIRGLSG